MSRLAAVVATLTLALLATNAATVGGSAASRVERRAESSARTGNAPDLAHSLDVSKDGTKVFVTGDSDGGMKMGYDYATVAYDASNGKKLWLARYNGSANEDDGGESLTLSSDGTKLFVAGATFSMKTGYDYGTIAYEASTGKRLWVARYNGPANGADGAEVVAVSADGTSVFATGTSWGGKATQEDFATVAYDAATGKRRWVARYDGPGHGVEEWASLTVSRDGTRVFVSGGSDGGHSMFDYVVIAYDAASGAQLWVSRYDGPTHGDDEATSITVSPDGTRVFLSGYSEDETGFEQATTIAYEAATGARLWIARHHGPGEDDDRGSALGLSPDGRKVFVTGFSSGETDNDYATVAYDSATGARLWAARYNGPANGYEWAHSLAVSGDGTKVFITGESEAREERNTHDYATIAYDASSGKQLWIARYNGPASQTDLGASVQVDAVGSRVFVTGSSVGNATRVDYATVAYAAGTGKAVWVARYNGPGVICLVPYVQGLPLPRAKAEIRRADCAVGRVTRIASKTKKGRVDRQDPKVGTRLAPKSPVRLWVSRGRR